MSDVKNPLVELREAAKLTVTELATEAGVSVSAVIRAEQAVYKTPVPKILDTLWEVAPEGDLHDYGVLMADYHAYQKDVRQDNYGLLDAGYQFPVGSLHPKHPFLLWRLDSDVSARIQISKAFCVHPALIFKFEVQPWLCAKPPGELIYALTESGYTNGILEKFGTAYVSYRKSGTK